MFVKTTRRKRGDKTYEYLSLVEAVRDGDRTGHRTLLRLGEVTALRASGQLERIIAALEAHLERDRIDVACLAAEETRVFGSITAVHTIWRRLGLDAWFAKVAADRGADALGDAVFTMVANRLVAPRSKRALLEWCQLDAALPDGVAVCSLDQYYRALDAVAATKEATEAELYAALCNLTNLDLRLVCYDLTSTFFEGATRASTRFPSRAFGYSRDHRSDRPQVVIGLLCTSDGTPIAHHVFAGNTADVTTLPGVLEDLQTRFGVGRICVVADRGLVSVDNVEVVAGAGFDHIVATRLHRDPTCAAALEACSRPDAVWVPVLEARSAACDVTLDDGRRAVVVSSVERWQRDTARTAELVARTEARLLALEHRVRAGELIDAGKIGRAAQRILANNPVARLFDIHIDQACFVYHYNDQAFAYEELLAGRYVLVTSLTPQHASTGDVVRAYRQLQSVEHRFRVLKDFLHLRPVRHFTERRVRGHVAICVYAAVIEAVITRALIDADLRDPDLADQHLTATRALRELDRIRHVTLDADSRTITLITRPTPRQARILAALDVDTTTWDRATIT
ncbi:MAG: IS1634 family transposase [Acidimicrobiales bacterium]|nr:IS1634 family transposase [Acidimicrobiales bacterium]